MKPRETLQKLVLSLLLCSAAKTVTLGEDLAVSKVSFSKQIAPILVAECLPCHNTEKPKGGYDLQTIGALSKPGKSGLSAIIPGEPEKSELYLRLVIKDEDDRMPQKDETLPASQIELIKRWIAEGASVDGMEVDSQISSLVPIINPAPPEKYPIGVPVLALQFGTTADTITTSGFHELLEWDLSGKLLNRITNVAQATTNIRLVDTNGTLAIVGGTPGKTGEFRLIHRGETNQSSTVLYQYPEVMLALAVKPDFSAVAVGGSDNAIRIFDLTQKKQTLLIQQHSDWVTSLSFSADGKHLLSGSRDRTARIYSTDDGTLETTYAEHGSAVLAVAFRPDNKHAYSAGKDKSIHLWRVEDGKKIREIGQGTGEIYNLIAVDKQLFAAGADRVIRQFDSNSGQLVQTFSGPKHWIYGLGISTQKGLIAAGTYDGFVHIWNVSNATEVATFKAAP